MSGSQAQSVIYSNLEHLNASEEQHISRLETYGYTCIQEPQMAVQHGYIGPPALCQDAS